MPKKKTWEDDIGLLWTWVEKPMDRLPKPSKARKTLRKRFTKRQKKAGKI